MLTLAHTMSESTIAGSAPAGGKVRNCVARLLGCILSVVYVEVVWFALSAAYSILSSREKMRVADTVPWWHSLIHNLSALLWQCWCRLLWLTEPGWLRPPPDAERVLLSALCPASRAAYVRSLRDWDFWRRDRTAPRTAAEFDLLLWEYLKPLARSRASTTLAAIEKTNPALRGLLPWSHALVGVIQLSSNIHHHLPMSWGVALLLARGMRSMGLVREGALLLLMWRIAARPAEALGLLGEHLMAGSRNHMAPGTCVVNLGVKYGTKVRRPQAVVVGADDWRCQLLVEAFVASTAPMERLFLFGLQQACIL